MNYKESQAILDKVKQAKKIIVNCHTSPDPDSIGSALSMYRVLISMGKDVKVYSPSPLVGNFGYLPDVEKIEVVDFTQLNYLDFDLFICLDSGAWNFGTGTKDFPIPNISLVVIDHHKSNVGFGEINLIDSSSPATAEILYKLYQDWEVDIDKDTANYLLTGILGDTGLFKFPSTTHETLKIGAELMEKGADRSMLVFNLFMSIDIHLMKFWGEIFRRLKNEASERFVWSAIPNDVYKEFGSLKNGRESFATVFLQSIKDTKFGMVMVEEEPQALNISFRSRTGKIDVSKIASDLGGGGHLWASGAGIKGMKFDEAVEKALEVSRNFLENEKSS